MKTPTQIWILTVCAAVLAAALLLAPWQEGEVRSTSEPLAEPGGSPEREIAASNVPAAAPAAKDPREAIGKPAAPLTPQDEIATFLSARTDLSDPAARNEFLAELQRLENRQAEETTAKAEKLGLPLLTKHGSLLVGFEGEVPLYEISHNAEAATSIGADLVRQSAPWFPDGEDHQIGLWDVYYGATNQHVETPFVNIKDDAVPGGFHASHVAGTLGALGIDPQARGMVPQAEIWSFSSSNVLSELAVNSATTSTDFGKLFVSVHPYGVASGWEYDGEEWYGNFSDDGDNSNDVPLLLGQYGSSTASWDGTAASFPHHLIVKSSGNHADDDAPQAGLLWYLNGSLPQVFLPGAHPKSDGAHTTPNGYGTVDARASAKNVLTVGSVSDAITAGVRDPGAAVLSAFSSTGPTDDGRIKPDLVGNGEDVYSVDSWTSADYITASGTSMSSAAVAGGAQLLQEISRDTQAKMLRSATLKALLIHTADDLETPGPDYRTGWGLTNIEAAAQLLYDHDANPSLERLNEEQLSAGDRMDYFMVPVDGSPLRITLCWTDEAGPWTNVHDDRRARLVNDLNLRLVNVETSETFYPYVMPFTSTWAESDLDAPATTGVNTVDNVEQIYLAAPAPGLYRIEVDYAGSLQSSDQSFSLLVSGTYLGEEGVEVESPVSDQRFLVADATPITVANVQQVFSGSGHQYSVSWDSQGILTASVDPAGNLQVVPTLLDFGQVNLTLTATDATGGTAQTTFAVGLYSTILRVNSASLAPPAEQNGSSWELAYGRLQDALEIAIPGHEIWVADGLYYPDERNAGDSDSRWDHFVVTDGVALYGGFSGYEIVRAARNANSGATILSGDILQDDLQQPIAAYPGSNPGDVSNSTHVVRVAGGASATIDGFVVTAGYGSDPALPDGGGIYVEANANLLLANCLLSGNSANGYGGGLCNTDGELNMVRCRFVGNKAAIGGGGLATENDHDSTLSHCEFRGNQGADGGALYIDDSWVYMTDCLISGNAGFFGGGGIHLNDGYFELSNCTLTGNFTYGQGGAIRVAWSTGKPYIYNSIIWKNSAGGSENGTAATAYGPNPGRRPYYEYCLVDNSGGSANWNTSIGTDGWYNLDTDPSFVAGIVPSATGDSGGDFRLTAGSPAINAGNSGYRFRDGFDLDGDGDVGERVPLDLANGARVISTKVDLGPYEVGDLTIIDGDNDGLSDAFEQAYGAAQGGDIDPASDTDGDGLMALAEFVHGLNPNEPLTKPVGDYASMGYLGSNYLCMTFTVNPEALNFVNITVERRANLNSPGGWLENQAVLHSSMASSTQPGMLELTYRSLVPFGQERMEFLRVRHDVIPGGNQTIPQSNPQGSISVSGWNDWGQ